jgi:hypothetical protein
MLSTAEFGLDELQEILLGLIAVVRNLPKLNQECPLRMPREE